MGHHPSDQGYRHVELPGQYVPGIGRQPSKVSVTYRTLKELLEADVVSAEFVAAHRLDTLEVPTTIAAGDTPVLDLARVAAELCRAPARRDDGPHLSTMVLTRSFACKVYDLGLVLAGKHAIVLPGDDPAAAPAPAGGVPLSQGDYAKVDWSNLVGEVVPYFTQAPRVLRDDPPAFQPIQPDAPHAFAFKPVVLSTASESRGDHGEVMAQGVVVSPRAFNFPHPQRGRVSLGVNPVFEETVCWVLITHAYAADHGEAATAGAAARPSTARGLPYASMNKPNKPRGNKRQREAPDPWEEVREQTFKWRAYEAFHADRLDQPGFKINSFGLLTTKMTHQHAARAIVTMSIPDVAKQLAFFRSPDGPGMDRYLVELPMTQVDTGHDKDVGGLDLRKMLMVERLVLGTPLEPLLRGQPPSFPFPAPVVGTPRSRLCIMKWAAHRWWRAGGAAVL